MSQSSPEGIILGKGSTLISAKLTVNKKVVLDLKSKEKSYTEKEMYELMDNYQNWLMYTNAIVLTFKEWFEQYRKKRNG